MIGSYLIDDITLRQNKGMDQWQEPLTPTDVAIKAFVEYGERWIQNLQGQTVVSLIKVHMRPRDIISSGYATRATNTISHKDSLVIDGQEHRIIRISKERDFSVRGLVVYAE